jgi:hypothetical protein
MSKRSIRILHLLLPSMGITEAPKLSENWQDILAITTCAIR